MNDQHAVHAICLKMFSGISATVSHDIKNALAIMNESAGLLDDLACMADEGTGVPVERVQAMTTSIAAQVTRANTILKDLNRFAHSGDAQDAMVDVKEALTLMVALTARKAAARNISIRIQCEEKVIFATQPLVFEALVYQLLITIYEKASTGSTVLAKVKENVDGLSLSFQSESSESVVFESTPSTTVTILARYLKLICTTAAEAVVIKCPVK